MHMGMQCDEFHVPANVERSIHAIVRLAGRNLEGAVRRGKRENALLRRHFRKNKTEFRLIGCGFSVWRVVHFKDDVRTGFDQLAFPGMKNFRWLAWRITDEKIAGQGARVRVLICLWRWCDKKYARLLILEVIRSGFAEVCDDVMHHGAVG